MAAMETFLRPEPFSRIAALVRLWFSKRVRYVEEAPDETRARRDFILEMMDECPDAFLHEDNMRTAMLYYSGRF